MFPKVDVKVYTDLHLCNCLSCDAMHKCRGSYARFPYKLLVIVECFWYLSQSYNNVYNSLDIVCPTFDHATN